MPVSGFFRIHDLCAHGRSWCVSELAGLLVESSLKGLPNQAFIDYNASFTTKRAGFHRPFFLVKTLSNLSEKTEFAWRCSRLLKKP
jgi:hypothetical protein